MLFCERLGATNIYISKFIIFELSLNRNSIAWWWELRFRWTFRQVSYPLFQRRICHTCVFITLPCDNGFYNAWLSDTEIFASNFDAVFLVVLNFMIIMRYKSSALWRETYKPLSKLLQLNENLYRMKYFLVFDHYHLRISDVELTRQAVNKNDTISIAFWRV